MRLRYTPEAREDLRRTEQYIAENLCNADAAKHVIANILKACSRLKEQPDMGIRLGQKIGRNTKVRYIICGKHLAFYLIEDQVISVIRILDSRTNYMQIIFNEKSISRK